MPRQHHPHPPLHPLSRKTRFHRVLFASRQQPSLAALFRFRQQPSPAAPFVSVSSRPWLLPCLVSSRPWLLPCLVAAIYGCKRAANRAAKIQINPNTTKHSPSFFSSPSPSAAKYGRKKPPAAQENPSQPAGVIIAYRALAPRFSRQPSLAAFICCRQQPSLAAFFVSRQQPSLAAFICRRRQPSLAAFICCRQQPGLAAPSSPLFVPDALALRSSHLLRCTWITTGTSIIDGRCSNDIRWHKPFHSHRRNNILLFHIFQLF